MAHALRREGRRVLAVDFDPQNTLRLHFGVPLADTAGFAAELRRHSDWRACARQTESGVLLLPHGTMDLRGALGLAAALEHEPNLLVGPMRDILQDPDLFVIADTAPGPSHAIAVLAPMATLVVAVLQAEALSAALVPDIISGRFLGTGTLASLYAGRLRVVLNGVDLRSRLSRASAEAVARHIGSHLLGAVGRDEALAEALACQKLIQDFAPDSTAAEDIRAVAHAIEASLPQAHNQAPLAWGVR